MNFKNYLLGILSVCTLSMAACGGGAGDDANAPDRRTFSAVGEARRMAVQYRPLRDLSAVLLPTLVRSEELRAFGGTTRTCSGGGNVAYTYNPGPDGRNLQSLRAEFMNCLESLGLISGSLLIEWNQSDDNTTAGTFIPSWSGTITVAGVTYVIDRPSLISLSYNTTSGFRESFIGVRSLSGLQGPTGPSLQMQQVQWRLIDDPAAANFQITDSTSNISNSSGPSANWRNAGAIQIARVASSTAVGGVGFPILGGFNYFRSQRSGDLEPISGDQIINSGLLNVSVRGSRTGLTDAGQFAWNELFQSATYNMDGE